MARKTDRRHANGEESRRRILQAAFEIAAELGYEGTSMAKVSERSGLPPSSLYWHFRNKDELLAAVIEESFEAWRASVPSWGPVPAGVTRRDHVAALLRRAVHTYATSPAFWRLGLMLALERRVVEASARARFLAIRERVLDVLADWWRSVLPPPDDPASGAAPELLAQFTMATTDGMFVASQIGDAWDFPALADLLADALDQAARTLAGAR
jgi:AcrR family transcriptional regulator